MSWLSMRMQPYESNVPIDSGLFVPWMAYSPPDRVMAATPIGLLGASHVPVSEAKKPCRTPLATGLHQNRTASDGQEPRPPAVAPVAGRFLPDVNPRGSPAE